MLMPAGSSPKALEAAQVVGRLLVVGSPIGSADVIRLWRLYSGDGPRPPLAVLQHAHLLQLLLSSKSGIMEQEVNLCDNFVMN